MSYQTNTGTITSLLNDIKTFSSTNGWIIDKDDITTNQELYLHSGLYIYFSIKAIVHPDDSTKTLLCIIGSKGYDTSLDWDNQPDHSIIADSYKNIFFMILPSSGTFDYHLFGTEDMISICVKKSTTYFNHMFFGYLYKSFDYQDGNTYGATYGFWEYNQRILVDGDVFDDSDFTFRTPYTGLGFSCSTILVENVWYNNESTETGIVEYNKFYDSYQNNNLFINNDNSTIDDIEVTFKSPLYLAIQLSSGDRIIVGKYRGIYVSGRKNIGYSIETSVTISNDEYYLIPIFRNAFVTMFWFKCFN